MTSVLSVEARARRVRLVLLDVDGVLTDGTVAIDSHGGEAKSFFIRDGAAIVWAQRHGLAIGLLSGRPSEATSRRAVELGIRIVSQGGPDKLRGYTDILAAHGHVHEEIAYMGDDLLDLSIMRNVGLAGAPADAAPEVLDCVQWISKHPGGRGAVREFIELILRARGLWPAVLEGFLA
jgi:3-deoxy-D-manno-octulosonate 8-phosphate phosphatase (KDO 8-P phosphatase)